ncbi:MAG TPA: hypothetical protein VJ873_01410 [bacterium]|nr:hypothetical protein [bacterium]
MKFDWYIFLGRLRAYPPHFHRTLPPCPSHRIEGAEKELGKLPETLGEMLRCFNGAKLFDAGLPFVRLFGISTMPPLPPLEWAPEWYIDRFTPIWRAAGSGRENDWAIAMTNYGGLVLLDAGGAVKEWDMGESKWLIKDLPFGNWVEKIMSEGEVMMAE